MTSPAFRGSSEIQDAVDLDETLVSRIQAAVNARMDEMGELSDGAQRQLAMHLITQELAGLALEAAAAGDEPPSDAQESVLRAAVFAEMFGLGRVEQILDDPEVEEVFINGSGPARLRYADGGIGLGPAVAESDESLIGLLRSIALHHGMSERSVTTTRPFLDLRLPDGSRLAAVWGITPHPQVTIRRHRFTDITLDDLVGMGMVSASMAAFLAAAVMGRRSLLVVGSPGSGKTTMLRGLAHCLPMAERFATMETEYELLLHEIPDRFPLLVPYEARPGTGEVGPDGRVAGEVSLADIFPTSLRHGLDRVIVGEVRGAEVIPMLMAMSRGYKGSMCTFHADSATDTFEALAALLGEHRANFSYAAAMAQIAAAVDIIVHTETHTTVTPAGQARRERFVDEILEVGPIGEKGQPTQTVLFGPDPSRPGDPRGYPLHLPENPAWATRAGLDLDWLTAAAGGWATPPPGSGP